MLTDEFKKHLSPFQEDYRDQFSDGDQGAFEKALFAFCSQGVASPPEIKHVTPKFSLFEMASPALEAQFLRFLLGMTGSKSVLEIGTFMGSTTLVLAEALPADGKIVSIEKGEEFSEFARKNIAESPYASRVEQIQGDALEVIPTLTGKYTFDFVFLDAAKHLYLELFEASKPLMTDSALLVADDVCFHGDALNEMPQSDRGKGTKKFVASITADPNWQTSILPIFNGVLLGRRI